MASRHGHDIKDQANFQVRAAPAASAKHASRGHYSVPGELCMTHSHHYHRHAIAPCLAVLLLLATFLLSALAACGSSSSKAVNQVKMVRHSRTVALQGGGQATVSCAPGEYLTSGGYVYLTNLADPAGIQENILASYPSDSQGTYSATPTAWTAKVVAIAGGQGLSVFANCLQAPFPVTVQAVFNGPGISPVYASCPLNTVRTGGGFQASTAGRVSSVPDIGDFNHKYLRWGVGGYSDGTYEAYAVCLSSDRLVQAPDVYGIPVHFPICEQGICVDSQQHDVLATCPQGQLLVGGGAHGVILDVDPVYESGQTSLYGNTTSADVSTWLVQVRLYRARQNKVFGNADYGEVEVDVVCLSVAKTPINVLPLPSFTPTPFQVIKSPVPTNVPTAPTAAIHFGVSPKSFSYTCQSLNDRPPAETVTLNNTTSKRSVAWQATITDDSAGTQTPWATVAPSSGTAHAGQIASLTLAPVAGLCSSLPNFGQTFHATVTLPNGGGGPFTISYEVKPPVIG
jgi:hypothetical protein